VRTLVLGGNRSGKSAYAEALLADEPTVHYVATAPPDRADRDWMARIAEHQARRPKAWTTIETGDVALAMASDGPPLLVDSITSWLVRTMDEWHAWATAHSRDVQRHVDELVEAWELTDRRAVLVSDEVGMGIVPEAPSGRRFRDDLGTVNQRLAAVADEVILLVAGLPLRLK
jgi:adenosylcobinamide kinase/adenosylcobinamide-phosphate guanylyltransferase